MPISRRGRGSTAATSRTTEPEPAWARGLREALAQAQRQFDPTIARDVVALMDHLPGVVDEITSFMNAMGSRSVEAVELPRGTSQIFQSLGSTFAKASGPFALAMAAAKRSVQDRINRYEANRRQDAAWDVNANNGGGGRRG